MLFFAMKSVAWYRENHLEDLEIIEIIDRVRGNFENSEGSAYANPHRSKSSASSL